jgi:hypothetical protein
MVGVSLWRFLCLPDVFFDEADLLLLTFFFFFLVKGWVRKVATSSKFKHELTGKFISLF